MLVLDTSIANVALLNIAGDLAAGVDEATWIIMLAYIDVFWVAAVFAALMVPLALILLRPVDTNVAPAVH